MSGPQGAQMMSLASGPTQTGGPLPPSTIPRQTGGPNPPARINNNRLLDQAYGRTPQGRQPIQRQPYTPWTPQVFAPGVTPNPLGIPPGYNNGGYVPFPNGMPGQPRGGVPYGYYDALQNAGPSTGSRPPFRTVAE